MKQSLNPLLTKNYTISQLLTAALYYTIYEAFQNRSGISELRMQFVYNKLGDPIWPAVGEAIFFVDLIARSKKSWLRRFLQFTTQDLLRKFHWDMSWLVNYKCFDCRVAWGPDARKRVGWEGSFCDMCRDDSSLGAPYHRVFFLSKGQRITPHRVRCHLSQFVRQWNNRLTLLLTKKVLSQITAARALHSTI